MTDEERFCNKRCYSNLCRRRCEYVSTYLDGLAAGKMRWHDLRKDPNDLPTLDGMYWTYNECGYYDIHIWIPQLWKECKVISWCELPKFEE